MEFPQIKRAKAALIALQAIYREGGSEEELHGKGGPEEELLIEFLTDMRLLSSEGYAHLSVNECVHRSYENWISVHPLKHRED